LFSSTHAVPEYPLNVRRRDKPLAAYLRCLDIPPPTHNPKLKHPQAILLGHVLKS
jgi:hypothetical protein